MRLLFATTSHAVLTINKYNRLPWLDRLHLRGSATSPASAEILSSRMDLRRLLP